MNRIAEFRSFLKSTETKPKSEDKFYEELYKRILDVKDQISQASSYKSLLVLEEKVDKLRSKSTLVLDSIRLDGPKDIQMHFEGIKGIINSAVTTAPKAVVTAKNRVSGAEIDLVPEQSKSFKRSNKKPSQLDAEATDQRPMDHGKLQENQLLEQENKEIVENTQYEATRQRLLRIEVVQKAIQENLALQDERIDSVCVTNDLTGKIYQKLNADEGIGSGSRIRRAVFVMIICFTCVLVFLHVYYRNN